MGARWEGSAAQPPAEPRAEREWVCEDCGRTYAYCRCVFDEDGNEL